MKNENIYYEYDNSEVQRMKEQGMINDDSAMQEMKRQAEQAYHEAEVAMQQMKEQGMINDDSAMQEMKRQAEQTYHEAEVAMQQMKKQGMILEKDNNDEKLGGRSR